MNGVQAKILRELIADGRSTESEIAKRIGETKEIVKRNIEEMEKTGLITGATIHINYKIFGYKAVAHMLINVDPKQESGLCEYLRKMPETYASYSRGANGNVEAVVILKSLEQLSEINDEVKKRFSIVEIRTAVWTDVKEMNDNLSITNTGITSKELKHLQADPQKASSPKALTLDKIDLKIADKLAKNGRATFQSLSEETGISPNAIKKRYERLRKNGALKVTIQSCPAKIGYRAMCIFFVVTSHENSLMIEKISEIPDIISIMKTTGDYDLQVWAMIKDIDHLLSIQEQLDNTTGILKVQMEVTKIPEVWPTPRQYISTF